MIKTTTPTGIVKNNNITRSAPPLCAKMNNSGKTIKPSTKRKNIFFRVFKLTQCRAFVSIEVIASPVLPDLNRAGLTRSVIQRIGITR